MPKTAAEPNCISLFSTNNHYPECLLLKNNSDTPNKRNPISAHMNNAIPSPRTFGVA
jgi:hypothetical protein